MATGGAADHLIIVYNTDDQVTFFMMTMTIIMAWRADHLAVVYASDDQVK